MGDKSLGKSAGYEFFPSGGGGAGGNYVFADLAELDGIIAEWIAVRDGVRDDGRKLALAKQLIAPPAKDLWSRLQAAATKDSLDRARDHNAAMDVYADDYIAKLQAARAQYSADDEKNAARMRGVDGG